MRIKVFGCKTNKYFAQQWLTDGGLMGKPGVLVASCVVTDQAKRRWSKFALREANALKSGEKLYLTGCGSLRNGEIDARFYEEYTELSPFRENIVLLPEEPPKSQANLQSDDTKKGFSSGIMGKIASLKGKLGNAELTRKTIVVQTGCDNFCTFCLTVQARGRHRTRDINEIIAEIRNYTESGGKEVVLTGINLGAWGAKSSNNFQEGRLPELIKEILAQTSVERLRISSLGVEFVADELLECFKLKRVHAYAHLSIQSGSDAILKKMGRHYKRATLLDRLQKLKNLERDDGVSIQIGGDLIVGFPGESNEDFEDTLSLVRDFGVTQLHAFPFSGHVDRYNVPAGKFPNQIPEHIKLARLRTLITAGDAAKQEFLRLQESKTFQLLLEGAPSTKAFKGWSENYIELTQENFEPVVGQKFERGAVINGHYRGEKRGSQN